MKISDVLNGEDVALEIVFSFVSTHQKCGPKKKRCQSEERDTTKINILANGTTNTLNANVIFNRENKTSIFYCILSLQNYNIFKLIIYPLDCQYF